MPAKDLGRKNRIVLVESNFVGIEVGSLTFLGPTQNANHLALAVDLKNTARHCVTHVEKVVRGDEQAEGVP